jgi:hypothetical protein
MTVCVTGWPLLVGWQVDHRDGTFFMDFEEWRKHFTHLFVGLTFPGSGKNTPRSAAGEPRWSSVVVAAGWDQDSGGNRQLMTWTNNPKLHIKVMRCDALSCG